MTDGRVFASALAYHAEWEIVSLTYVTVFWATLAALVLGRWVV